MRISFVRERMELEKAKFRSVQSPNLDVKLKSLKGGLPQYPSELVSEQLWKWWQR
jgi:hypothetical protein